VFLVMKNDFMKCLVIKTVFYLSFICQSLSDGFKHRINTVWISFLMSCAVALSFGGFDGTGVSRHGNL